MTRRYVSHGADNPNLNLHTQPGIEVRGGKDYMSVYHPSSDISYSINRKGKTKIGNRPVYNVQWQHHKSTDMSPKEKITVGRDAKDVWDYHVQHRLPHGAVLRNSPVPNPTSKNPQKNTRARLYQKSGFGPVGQRGLSAGQQFALVGRKPSTKQIRKGKTRLSPLSGNTQYDAYD